MADPRQLLIQQMMEAKAARDNMYKGQRGSPDLPSTADQQLLNRSGDAGWKQFIDQFGLERERNPAGPPAGYVPMPRPRMPDMQVGSSPLGDEALQPPAAGLKTSDIMRNMQEPPYETIQDVQGSDNRSQQPTDEQMLDDVHDQMGGFDWEGGDGAPTQNDVKYALKDPDLYKEFVKQFGGTPEEFQDNPDDNQGD